MRVVVLMELTGDVALREQSADVRDERIANDRRVPDQWRILQVNPADAAALDVALGLKDADPSVHVTLLHLGPPDAAQWMREELARGGDAALRVWDDELTGAATAVKALALTAAVRTGGFDLVLAGTANAVSAGGQLGVLLARHLGVPCVTQARVVGPASVEAGRPLNAPQRLTIMRALARGFRERVEVTLPAVITVVAAAEAAWHMASVNHLVEAQGAELPVLDLATLGVPREAVRRAGAALRPGSMRPPRPRLRFIPTPDQAAPAFDRILQMVAGVVRQREGRVVRGDPEAVVQELFDFLRREGWLDHLRRGNRDLTRPADVSSPDP